MPELVVFLRKTGGRRPDVLAQIFFQILYLVKTKKLCRSACFSLMPQRLSDPPTYSW